MKARHMPPGGLLYPILTLIVVGVAALAPAQNLVVARAPSLGEVLEAAQTVARAAGQDVDQQTLLARALAVTGLERTDWVALDRPVAVVLPVAGMMMQQKGLVAAVPVTDAAAALEALAGRFASHTVEGKLYTFATAEGPALYVLEEDGYLRVGGSSSLVQQVDPLAGTGPEAGVLVEVFLEPVAPMIEAGLQAARQQMEVTFQAGQGGSQMPYDPAAMRELTDLYLNGVQSLLANASSLQIAVDVRGGFVRYRQSLIAKEGSSLAGFISAQKGGLPAMASVADQDAAMYAAGRVTITDEPRRSLETFLNSYWKVMETTFASNTSERGAGTPEEGSDASGRPDEVGPWGEYMALTLRLANRWLSCWNGDLAVSFDFGEGGRLELSEAFGLRPEEDCRELVKSMAEEIQLDLDKQGSRLADMMAASQGPVIGGQPSLVLSFDTTKLLESMGQATDDSVEETMKAFYGDRVNVAMVDAGHTALWVLGQDPETRLRRLAEAIGEAGSAPSFAPLSDGPGLFAGMNLGLLVRGFAGVHPEVSDRVEDLAETLSGEAGRIPMALRFGENALSGEAAVPLKTIEVLANLVRQKRAAVLAEASAEPDPETELESVGTTRLRRTGAGLGPSPDAAAAVSDQGRRRARRTLIGPRTDKVNKGRSEPALGL